MITGFKPLLDHPCVLQEDLIWSVVSLEKRIAESLTVFNTGIFVGIMVTSIGPPHGTMAPQEFVAKAAWLSFTVTV